MIESIRAFVPQSGRMVLLDRVLTYDAHGLTAQADVTEAHIFAQHHQLPAWATIEMMAQGIALLDGIHAQQKKQAVRKGFLLGARRFSCALPQFPIPCQLEISVKESLFDSNGFGVFDCAVRFQEEVVARASISVFSPPNVEDYLEHDNG